MFELDEIQTVNQISDDKIEINGDEYAINEDKSAVDREGNVVLPSSMMSEFIDVDDEDKKDDKADDKPNPNDDPNDDKDDNDNKDDDNKDDDKKDDSSNKPNLNLDELSKIKIGDDIYELDENKNAVDKDGNVIHKREELESMINSQSDDSNDDKSDDDLNYVSELSKITNITIKDENGKEKQYENTIEGLAQRERDLIEYLSKDVSNKSINNFFEKNPEIKAMYEYKQIHGDIDNFDYEESKLLNIKDKDIENISDSEYKEIIRRANEKRGFSKERINKLIQYSEDSNSLLEDAKDDLKFLKSSNQQEQTIKQKEKEQEFVGFNGFVVDESGKVKDAGVDNSLYDLFMKRSRIGDLVIPDNFKIDIGGTPKTFSKEDVFYYMVAPYEEGATMSMAEYELKQSLKDPETFSKLALYNLLGGLNQLAKEETTRTHLKNLKNKTKNKKPTVSTVDDDIDINDSGITILGIE